MTEGFIHPQDAPTRRGRRDPELAQRLESELIQPGLDDPASGDSSEQAFIGLAPGDIVMAKVTHAVTRNDGGDSWFSYGVQARVLENETEEDTFIRVATIANERVLDMADDADQRIAEIMSSRSQAQQGQRRR